MCWTDEQAKEVIEKFEIQINNFNEQEVVEEVGLLAGELCDFGPENFSEEEQEQAVDMIVYMFREGTKSCKVWNVAWKIRTNNH